MKVELIVNKIYTNGQTDGMKLYKSNHAEYVFAANKKDAIGKIKAGLTIPWSTVYNYLQNLYLYVNN